MPSELDEQFWVEVSNFEENQEMQYITSVERIGEAKGRLIGIQIGRQEGEQKGEVKMLTRQLQRRFGTLPPWASQKIAEADLSAWRNGASASWMPQPWRVY